MQWTVIFLAKCFWVCSPSKQSYSEVPDKLQACWLRRYSGRERKKAPQHTSKVTLKVAGDRTWGPVQCNSVMPLGRFMDALNSDWQLDRSEGKAGGSFPALKERNSASAWKRRMRWLPWKYEDRSDIWIFIQVGNLCSAWKALLRSKLQTFSFFLLVYTAAALTKYKLLRAV